MDFWHCDSQAVHLLVQHLLLNIVIEWLAFLFHIQEVSGLTFVPEASHLDWFFVVFISSFLGFESQWGL
jgi:hypothetical protein